jgi:alpha-D-ribose 1-methylphosphonate 5-triphosphate synthase subunit PhnH
VETSLDTYQACITDVHESQAIFRCLLTALCQPGRIEILPSTVRSRIAPALAPLMALLSHDTPFTVIGNDSSTLSTALAQATFGRATNPDDASFVALMDDASMDLRTLRHGTDHRPDEACQVSIAVAGSIRAGDEHNAAFGLTGPGVPERRWVAVDADDTERTRIERLLAMRVENPPCGFDVWLIDSHGAVVGLPRTTRLEFEPQFSTSKQGI